MKPMHISVAGFECALNPQTRAYAEYRVFSVLARYADEIDNVRIVVSAASQDSEDEAICVIEVDRPTGDTVRARARAAHSYSAIDSAADGICRMLHRHIRNVAS